MITRRSMLLGLGAASITLAAPAIVRAESLMKIVAPPTTEPRYLGFGMLNNEAMWRADRFVVVEVWEATVGYAWRKVYYTFPTAARGKIISEIVEPRLPFTIMPEEELRNRATVA